MDSAVELRSMPARTVAAMTMSPLMVRLPGTTRRWRTGRGIPACGKHGERPADTTPTNWSPTALVPSPSFARSAYHVRQGGSVSSTCRPRTRPSPCTPDPTTTSTSPTADSDLGGRAPTRHGRAGTVEGEPVMQVGHSAGKSPSSRCGASSVTSESAARTAPAVPRLELVATQEKSR